MQRILRKYKEAFSFEDTKENLRYTDENLPPNIQRSTFLHVSKFAMSYCCKKQEIKNSQNNFLRKVFRSLFHHQASYSLNKFTDSINN